MASTTDFTKLDLSDFYWQDAEAIFNACKKSDTIQKQKDTRACGDEVEIAIRNFYKSKLEPKYYVSHGHLVDENLSVSPQLDIIIADNIKVPVLNTLADNSDIIYYESVYAYCEVKKSFYDIHMLDKISSNLERIKLQLKRSDVSPNTIECSIDNIQVNQQLTSSPRRNMLFSFVFIVRSEEFDLKYFKILNEARPNAFIPNMIVLLDSAVIVNVDKQAKDSGVLKVNLYPELTCKEESVWIRIGFDEPSKCLAYSYMLLMEHLNSTILGTPNFQKFNSRIFAISEYDLSEL